MNKMAAKQLIGAREARHLTQSETAKKLGIALNQTYSLRQYQKLEQGMFPKYKKEVISELDKILGTNLYTLIYEQNIPRGTQAEENALLLNDSNTGTENYLQKRRALKNATTPYMVPLVPAKAQAGYAANYNNTDFINQLELYPILPGIDPRGAVWRFFEVAGESMEPSLFNSDLVLVSMVPHADWQDIKKGEIYVVVTDDDEVFIKQVFPINKDSWILRSVNKRKGEKEILLSKIKEVWRYRRHVTNKIHLPKT